MAETAHPDTEARAEVEGSSQAPKDITPVYEIGFHIVPTVGEEGVPAVLDRVRALLGDAEIISESFPQKMTLAYRIERAQAGAREKYTESYFGVIKFATEREHLSAIEKGVQGIREVMRVLIIGTVREDITQHKQRTVFSSDRLEGKVIEKPAAQKEVAVEVSEEELDKSIEALTG
ncbi:hypothetical protein A3D70_01150 [Candidatus Adlerbacteria bacterium RIFCSPHIGHO2_02_FULL_54_18]|uniref:30S ribosomal protein S6 n=2 Tax=Candidatus Adleribacteriota TaxID=1752736 RepID=A0A1F4Y4X7_9BACT|nr:MAG: hypothetical protein A2949_02085 [Candidatus Adlerbacteria bacterium RIFCSPLOWO2_01_FULL_54_21b]OGC89025.1 MAG: hypothetical protein A3D70_01150 [Candidatus Adlerbacteria bacterium RIFCSPHIGHO2_02_FULL_54_18]